MSSVEQSIKQKIDTIGTPLHDWNIKIYRGILTGCNEAFIINGAKKDELIAADPNSAEIIRPILRGKDVKRYNYDFADLWLINVHNGIKKDAIPAININDYPAVKAHLDKYYDKLCRRSDKGDTPYNLRNCVYMDDFSKQKIVYREISTAMDACLVGPDIMLNNKCYLITGEHLIYLLTFFNSDLFTKIILPEANITGGKGENFLNLIKAVIPSQEMEDIIINEYEKFSLGKIALEEFDLFVDSFFCELYNLTEEEWKYISSID